MKPAQIQIINVEDFPEYNLIELGKVSTKGVYIKSLTEIRLMVKKLETGAYLIGLDLDMADSDIDDEPIAVIEMDTCLSSAYLKGLAIPAYMLIDLPLDEVLRIAIANSLTKCLIHRDGDQIEFVLYFGHETTGAKVDSKLVELLMRLE